MQAPQFPIDKPAHLCYFYNYRKAQIGKSSATRTLPENTAFAASRGRTLRERTSGSCNLNTVRRKGRRQ
jgi:hypothetical protein